MATCKQQQERIEEEVVQPIDEWVERQEQRCREEPCIWWMLCLNKLFCWVVTTLVKVVVWVLVLVVRWVFRIVCTGVSLVIGLLALAVGNTSRLVEAVGDAWQLIKDACYTAVGAVIYTAIRLVDFVQSAVGLQEKGRPLSKGERDILWPVFRDSLNYNAIRIVERRLGLLGISGRPFTIGFTIYMPSVSNALLVHECVHVWQFEFGGTQYIGNSALIQLDRDVFSRGYDPYAWQHAIDAGATWYTLRSVEAQARFIQTVYGSGRFVPDDGSAPDTGEGAFFRDHGQPGHNDFQFGRKSYTDVANTAWRILSTG